MFDGTYLHGVVPGRGPSPQAGEYTPSLPSHVFLKALSTCLVCLHDRGAATVKPITDVPYTLNPTEC